MNKKPDSLFKFQEKDIVGGTLYSFYALLNNLRTRTRKENFDQYKQHRRKAEDSRTQWLTLLKNKTVSFKLKLIQLEILY